MKDLEVVQKNELIILKEIKRICEKYNLTYYLSSGSLLGAIRHGGFIPWDDDIDVEMPLQDYRKFLKIWNTELDKKFFLQNFSTDYNDNQGFTKIRMNNTTFMPVHHTKHYIHHGFWVDIFPVIRVPKNEKLFALKKKIVMLSNYVQIGNFMDANENEFKSKLGSFRYSVIRNFNKLPIRFRILIHKFLLFFVLRKPKQEKCLALMWTTLDRLPKNIYNDLENYIFVDDYFKIPKKYHVYLKMMYGDYMKLPAVEDRQAHGSMIVDESKNFVEYLK